MLGSFVQVLSIRGPIRGALLFTFGNKTTRNILLKSKYLKKEGAIAEMYCNGMFIDYAYKLCFTSNSVIFVRAMVLLFLALLNNRQH